MRLKDLIRKSGEEKSSAGGTFELRVAHNFHSAHVRFIFIRNKEKEIRWTESVYATE